MISLSFLLRFFLCEGTTTMTDNSLIYILTVSKSLLIVLGTSPKAPTFWSMESAALWKTKTCFPQDLDNEKMLPTLTTAPITAALFSLAFTLWTQERRGRPTLFLLVSFSARRTVRKAVLLTSVLPLRGGCTLL